MSNLDLMLAQTQRNITYAYCLMFAGAVGALLFLPKPLDDSIKTLLITMLGVLGTLITMQNQFWFARSRTAGIPDPVTTTITTESPPPPAPQTTTVTMTPTTTTETPNATTTTTVQPVTAPAPVAERMPDAGPRSAS